MFAPPITYYMNICSECQREIIEGVCMQERYKTIDDNVNMGFDNEICEFRDYFCGLHRVYMSSVDVRRKKCLCKPTFDMIGTIVCPYIRKLEE